MNVLFNVLHWVLIHLSFCFSSRHVATRPPPVDLFGVVHYSQCQQAHLWSVATGGCINERKHLAPFGCASPSSSSLQSSATLIFSSMSRILYPSRSPSNCCYAICLLACKNQLKFIILVLKLMIKFTSL